jgi:protein-L-isoaspartate(D-aspartate) O-methyltransferase
MVRDQLEKRGIKDKRVLDVFNKVKRHLFVPRQYRIDAYGDYPLPIGDGQTISQPYMVAIMTELLRLKGDEKVLEIGTGSGYQAAILSLLAKEVYAIEIIPSLAKIVVERLSRLGYKNISVRCGDGYFGWPEKAPFDRIIITCAIPYLSNFLKEQLKEGGKIVAPVGEENEMQILTVFEKKKGEITKEGISGCFFVPMTGKIQSKTFD